MRRHVCRLVACVIVAGPLGPAVGAETRVGVEAGTSAEREVDVGRLVLDRTVLPDLPVGGSLVARPRLALSLGVLQAWSPGRWQQARISEGALRLVVQLSLARHPRAFLEAGSGPVYLSRRRIGRWDLGKTWQFRSHVGLGARLGRRISLTYRYSHTSNANLGDPNPGINFHALLLSYRI